MDGWMDYEHRNKTLFFLIIVKDIDSLCIDDPGNTNTHNYSSY